MGTDLCDSFYLISFCFQDRCLQTMGLIGVQVANCIEKDFSLFLIFRLTAWIDKGQWSLNWLLVKQCSTNIGLFYKMILYTVSFLNHFIKACCLRYICTCYDIIFLFVIFKGCIIFTTIAQRMMLSVQKVPILTFQLLSEENVNHS